ncbi:hypothetical protein H0B56_17090 [Haloechinothrix sp. YIM 98757]|uniref:Uncharacterized protein n=2 Tax=Haloechinothrix aidingensis TaxID=2752311 RepID=A0A838ADR3_9PSEU|nr:hypothetical protein [Haloechinothrix aidingensis]
MSPEVTLTDGRTATMVREHTWLWVDSEAWTEQSARVSAGPVWAEAVAVPRRLTVEWSTGERTSCAGPGTPYDRSYGMHEPSPDCGLRLTQSTYGLPGEQAEVEYAITWSVRWQGSDGASDEGGELATMVSRASEHVVVAEAQSLRQD